MLTSLQNPLVKQMRKLHRARERREQQMFLLEGTHLLEEALAVGWELAIAFCTPGWQAQHEQLWQQASLQAGRTEQVSPEVLEAIVTTVHPDGVVAAAVRHPNQRPPAQPSLGIALESLQDPGNLGTLIRTAAAAGVDGLWLSSDSVDLDHPKVLRSSAGQWFRLPMAVCEALPIEVLQQQGVQVIATLPEAELTYWQADLRQPTLLLLGNEGAGLSPALIAIADLAVSIPLATGVESLNVAIAAALILYEAQRQRRLERH
jgi:RNA methyltransferase, TrmH family